MLTLLPLHQDFGIEIVGLDLGSADLAAVYPVLRALFEEHSLLLLRGQHLSDERQLALGRFFGPLEDREIGRAEPEICPVSNVVEGGVYAADDLRLLDLLANGLWHTDSTFLPVPALANLAQARVVPSLGGETEFASTRAGWRDLDATLRARLRGRVLRHRYGHSRGKIDPRLLSLDKISRWPEQRWPAVLTNPVNGRESLYIASHAYAVEGLDTAAGAALIEAAIEAVTLPEQVYSHRWQVGDLLIWDERAVLHRGRPWPYNEPRTLASICVSLQEADGLSAMRAA